MEDHAMKARNLCLPRFRRSGAFWLTAGLLLAALAGSAPARTWTSTSGATVEADFVARDGQQVILERPGGARLTIRLNQLTPEDQAWITNEAIEAPATVDPPPAESLPGITYTAPSPPLTIEAFPPVSLTQTNRATYWGFQYGPAASNALYCVFDFAEDEQPPERMYVVTPGDTVYPAPTPWLSRGGDYREQRIRIFRGKPLTASHGDWTLTHELTFQYGMARFDVAWVKIETQAKRKKDRKTYRFTQGGFITDQVVSGAGPIPVLRALRPLEFVCNPRVYRGRPQVEPVLKMGSFALVPGSNLDDEIRVEVTDPETERVVERLEIPLREESLVDPNPWLHRAYLDLRSGKTYQVQAGLNLGPLLGSPMDEGALDMPYSD